MLSVVMLSVIMLSVANKNVTPSIFLLNVI